MKEFTPRGYLDFLGKLERMKSVPRHSITVEGVKESVAACAPVKLYQGSGINH